MFSPLVCIVDFHHSRGPEVERWIGTGDGGELSQQNDWSLLPFLALPDGSHASDEEFSYFTLRQNPTSDTPPSSLFGVSCTRHIAAKDLLHKNAEVTRTSVQKAIVAIVDSPYHFARIREKLSAVTKTWFAQRDFEDQGIVKQFQESLERDLLSPDDDRDQYFGISLRELMHEYKWELLVLFKSCLLQPKMLFFGSDCERMCMFQFALISLIPGLLHNLQDCADPSFNSKETSMVMASSLKTSDRNSLLAYMGCPLQIFGKGSLFGPYTPLQQIDVLADKGTKSFIAGSTNGLLLLQKDKYDIVVNLDERTTTISNPTLKPALVLTIQDRRWIDFITQTVNDTWDAANPSQPTTHGYSGSDEFIRLQFEEYLLALLASAKYHSYTGKSEVSKPAPLSVRNETDPDPLADFGPEYTALWQTTPNARIFDRFTDSHLFDIVDPKHPCAGALTVEDIQRRVASQIAELHLDERFASGREVVGRHLATGQKKVSAAVAGLWADIEARREARRRNEERGGASSEGVTGSEDVAPVRRGPDFAQAQAHVQAASARTAAYISSWRTWAVEKRTGGFNWNAGGSKDRSPAGTPRTGTPPPKE